MYLQLSATNYESVADFLIIFFLKNKHSYSNPNSNVHTECHNYQTFFVLQTSTTHVLAPISDPQEHLHLHYNKLCLSLLLTEPN